MVDLHDFINYLNSSIDENFPNTLKYIVNSSDNIKDIIMELREDNKVLRYSPYKLFTESINYEDNVDEFIKLWRCTLVN